MDHSHLITASGIKCPKFIIFCKIAKINAREIFVFQIREISTNKVFIKDEPIETLKTCTKICCSAKSNI